MINVVGLGYIGLPTSLMLAKSGLNVVGTDLNSKIIEKLNNNELSFKEEGLKQVFDEAIKNGIKFSTECFVSDLYIIAVPTPFNETTKQINPQFILSALENILNVCKENSIVVIESTISPGTIDKYVRPFVVKNGKTIGKDIHLAHAPERIIPGNMIFELENNSRTIGVDSAEIGSKIKEIYSSFCKGEIIITDIRSAEMSKVVENTYRDINIAFANELLKICRKEHLDVYEIIKLANRHPRVNILQPGPGVGGHCIPVDPWFLVGDNPELTNLIYQARVINDSMPAYVLNRVDEIMRLKGLNDYSKIGIYGIAYKEDVDDIRESPALHLLKLFSSKGINNIKLFDPILKDKINDNQYLDFNRFLNDIEMLIIITAHTHLKENIENLKHLVILDTRNIIRNYNVYKL